MLDQQPIETVCMDACNAQLVEYLERIVLFSTGHNAGPKPAISTSMKKRLLQLHWRLIAGPHFGETKELNNLFG